VKYKSDPSSSSLTINEDPIDVDDEDEGSDLYFTKIKNYKYNEDYINEEVKIDLDPVISYSNKQPNIDDINIIDSKKTPS
jgi:hypothetical protein